LDEVVAVSAEVATGSVVSMGSAVVVEVEEVSGEVSEADVEAPSTVGVEVELSNGGALTM
jgi:hypothetical protein